VLLTIRLQCCPVYVKQSVVRRGIASIRITLLESEFQTVTKRNVNKSPEKGLATHAHNAANIVKDDRARVVNKFSFLLGAVIGP